MKGLEPSTAGTTIRSSNQIALHSPCCYNGAPCRIRTRGLRLRRPLLYPAELRARIPFSERETGFEPATYGLEGHRSSQLSYSRMSSAWIGARRFELPTPCSQSRCANQTALRPAAVDVVVQRVIIIIHAHFLSRRHNLSISRKQAS